MDIKIQAIHFDATSKLEDFINKKLDRMLRRNPAVTSVDVILKVVKPETAMNKQVRLVVDVPSREQITAEKTADTFEAAVDITIEAIERQLEKLKEKEA